MEKVKCHKLLGEICFFYLQSKTSKAVTKVSEELATSSLKVPFSPSAYFFYPEDGGNISFDTPYPPDFSASHSRRSESH
jgi:hypothetical protein